MVELDDGVEAKLGEKEDERDPLGRRGVLLSYRGV
jgi:hypothetical protein